MIAGRDRSFRLDSIPFDSIRTRRKPNTNISSSHITMQYQQQYEIKCKISGTFSRSFSLTVSVSNAKNILHWIFPVIGNIALYWLNIESIIKGSMATGLRNSKFCQRFCADVAENRFSFHWLKHKQCLTAISFDLKSLLNFMLGFLFVCYCCLLR